MTAETARAGVHSEMVGRAPEIAMIMRLLDRIDELGGALVVHGQPGIGKSRLLQRAAEDARARGFRVLVTVGVETEVGPPFAGIHELLLPNIAQTRALADGPRGALEAALGLGDGSAPDLFLVGMAILALVGDLSADRPILIVADDVQWLDAASADALLFAARRFLADRVVVLAAARTGHRTPWLHAGLAEAELGALDGDDAVELLDRCAPALDRATRSRVLSEAAGNPLALIELPRTVGELGPDRLLPSWLPITSRLQRAFTARLAELPAAARAIVLVAAVDDGDDGDDGDGDDAGEMLDAAATLIGGDVGLEDLSPAVAANLLHIDAAAVRFTHPLVRSAVRQAAPLDELHDAHAALAETLRLDPDRRVWHLAASAHRVDDGIADELEAAALRARSRGAATRAVEALERSAQLTSDGTARGHRLLRAAELAFELGRPDLVRHLLDHADPLALAPLDRRRVRWLTALFDESLRTGSTTVLSAVALADDLRASDDPERALDPLVSAAQDCWWSAAPEADRIAVAEAALSVPVAPEHPKRLAALAFAAPIRHGREVLRTLDRIQPSEVADAESLRLLATAAEALGDVSRAALFLDGALSRLRSEGRLALVARALVSEGWAAVKLGRWASAGAAADEGVRLAAESAQPRWGASCSLIAAVIAGYQGDEATAVGLVDTADRVLLPANATAMLCLVQMARGSIALGSSRFGEAFDHLARVFDPSDVAFHDVLRGWMVFDLAEAAGLSGEEDEARRLLAAVAPLATATGSPVITANVLCATALLAPRDHAEEPYLQALAGDLDDWPFLRARVLLAFGTWLRRRRRVVESRAHLRASRDAFDSLSATPWSNRANQELRAAGETVAGHQPNAGALTPQEFQIATLATQGLSNRDIGQRLFLSHRTVGAHLYRIFPKLGVTSRTELASVLRLDGARA